MTNGPEQKQQGERIRALLNGTQTRSGVRFFYEHNTTGMFPPDQADFAADALIGGFAVTRRDRKMTEEDCPGVYDAVDKERGKIIILGSGLSTLTTDVAVRYETGQLAEKPVIVDLFDYQLAERDLLDLRGAFDAEVIDFPLGLELSRTQKTAAAIRRGHVDSVTYLVGSGNPPKQLSDASLILNIYGPPPNTVTEQLSFLKPGGVLKIASTYLPKVPNRQEYSMILNSDARGNPVSTITKNVLAGR